MRVLILGGTGMLGHALIEACRARFDTWTTIRTTLAVQAHSDLFHPSRTVENVDATRFGSVAAAIDRVAPDVVVNAIGVVKQAEAASDAVTTVGVNGLFPHQLARHCDSEGVRLVHISTDCVFSGRRGMYREEDPPDADDFYGRTKRLGEVKTGRTLTLRTSFVGRELNTRRGLLEWCLSQRGRAVRGYTRAVFNGLTSPVVADLVASLLSRPSPLAGIYHVSGDPIDKCALLCLFRDAFSLDLDVQPVATPAIDRTLDSSRFRAVTGFHPPDWPSMVADLARRHSPAVPSKQ